MPLFEPQHLYSAVEKSFKSQAFAPIYYFFGEESFLLQQAVQYLKTCSLVENAADFNWRIFNGDEDDTHRIKDEIETYPMMAPRRVVWIREISHLTEGDWAVLTPLLENPVASTVLILTSQKADRRKKIIQKLIDVAVTVEFKKPYENQIPSWINHIVKGHALRITDEALQVFHQLVGDSLIEIDSEIRKLKNYLGERSEIDVEDVRKCVSPFKEENVFKFAELLGDGRLPSALLQAVALLDQGQSELGVVALTARHFRILLNVKIGESQGLAGAKLAALAQVAPYFLKNYQRQTRQWSVAKLENVILFLAECEKALKSSPLSAGIWIENMITKICQLHSTSVESVPAKNTLLQEPLGFMD
ncbi:MAG: DNA polymerase III subunit delta [Bdellovibrio sp.]|nr:MAG: DNA polymerase III subunit delta [Bdellovibrio sp.]